MPTARAATNAANASIHARPPTPEPLRFALTGPSLPIDHQRSAARRDLADIKLAGRWFAPHYARPQIRMCVADCTIYALADMKREAIGTLSHDERFAVIELAGEWAWGYRERDDRVGYVRVDALGAFAT